MSGNRKKMTCVEFQALIPELIGSGEDASFHDASLHPHARECEMCRALLTELETIAEAARKMFPGGGPPIH